MAQWENLRRVRKRHRPFTSRVKRRKEKHKESNTAQVGLAGRRNEMGAEPSGQEGPGELGEGKQEQLPPAPPIDSEECRESESRYSFPSERKRGGCRKDSYLHEVHETEAPAAPQDLRVGESAGLLEDCGGEECDDVDLRHVSCSASTRDAGARLTTAHLLRDHDGQ
jgi:hypothetical protein